MEEGLRREHLEAVFAFEAPPEGLPLRFGIVTAYNPGITLQPPAANLKADAELKKHLMATGLKHFRATGGSRDGSHKEPGWGVISTTPEAVRLVSRKFGQEAFYWVEGGTLFLIYTEGEKWHKVDFLTSRLAAWTSTEKFL